MQAPKFSSLVDARSARRAALAGTRASSTVSSVCSQPFDIGGEYTTIDGRDAGGPIVMQPGQKQLWRVVNASADGYFDLSIDGQNLRLVSRDGVALEHYPGAVEQNLSDVVIPPAGVPISSSRGRRTPAPRSAPRVSIRVRAVTRTRPKFSASSTPVRRARCPSFPHPARRRARGTYDQTIGAAIAQRRTVAFTEDANGFYLNGQAYGPTGAPMFVAQAGTVEQWTLANSSTEVHAFHIHRVHDIVQDVDGVARPAQWRDTFTLPVVHADGTPSVTHVLIDIRDPLVRGTFLLHCHLLENEDGGIMAKIQVQ